MFTGLIEEVAKVRDIKKSTLGARLCVQANLSSYLKVGESVCINGACQTVIACDERTFEVEVMNETLRRTNLADAKDVNLERAMSMTSRFDGHFVSGHIDGIAKFANIRKDGFSNVMRFEYPTKQMVLKGSVCVNGVSLTISKTGDDYFEVSLIPHTLSNTNLSELRTGDFVNIETDIIAKYVEKMCSAHTNAGANERKIIDEKFLAENGF